MKPATRTVKTGSNVKLTVKAKGKAAKTLRRLGRVRVKATIVFKPTGGSAATKSRVIRLVKKSKRVRPASR